MRSLLTNKLPWLALGVGVPILVAGIFVSRSLFQADQHTGSMPAANQEKPAGLATIAASSAGNARMSELAGPDSSGVGLGLVPVEDVAMVPSAGLDAINIDPGMLAAEGVAMNDSAELKIREEGPPAPRGGPGEVASFQDGAELVVRDADGNIKRQVTVR